MFQFFNCYSKSGQKLHKLVINWTIVSTIWLPDTNMSQFWMFPDFEGSVFISQLYSEASKTKLGKINAIQKYRRFKIWIWNGKKFGFWKVWNPNAFSPGCSIYKKHFLSKTTSAKNKKGRLFKIRMPSTIWKQNLFGIRAPTVVNICYSSMTYNL